MYRCDVVNENEHHRIFILKAMCNRWEGGKGAWDGCTSWCIDKIAGKGLENNWYILVYDKMIKGNDTHMKLCQMERNFWEDEE